MKWLKLHQRSCNIYYFKYYKYLQMTMENYKIQMGLPEMEALVDLVVEVSKPTIQRAKTILILTTKTMELLQRQQGAS